MSRAAKLGREAVLSLAAILGLICILWAVGTVAFGLKPLVFTSGSMSPAIAAGDLALARDVPAKDLAVGDVVSVLTAEGPRVTHRITAIDLSGDQAALTLKGDANSTPDAETYRVDSAERIWFHVPKAGYVVKAVSSPAAMVLGGGLVVAAFFIAFSSDGPGRGRRGGEPKGGRRKATRGGGRKSAAGVAVAAALAGGTLVVPAAVPTLAAFSDTGSATGTVKARTVTAPASMTCANNTPTGGVATLTFTNAASNASNFYVVEYATTATGAATKTDTVSAGAGGGTASVAVSTGVLGGLFSGTTLYVRVYAAATGATPFAWKTTDYRAWQFTVGVVSGRVTCVGSVK